MANYVVSDSSLSVVADAIRAKGGTSGAMAFPAGFVSAVEAIPVDGDTSTEDSIVTRDISGIYKNSRVTRIGMYAFARCFYITEAQFPACTGVGGNAFYGCSNLSAVSFPSCTTIGQATFALCSQLTAVNFPICRTVGQSAFSGCIGLLTASIPAGISIASNAFSNCRRLISFYLLGSSLCTLSNSNAFSGTPIGGYSTTAGQYGSIYVPASLLSSYQEDAKWSYYSSRFVGLTDEEIAALEG